MIFRACYGKQNSNPNLNNNTVEDDILLVSEPPPPEYGIPKHSLPHPGMQNFNNPNQKMLSEILEDPQKVKYFYHFLKSEFSEEWLDFYMLVNEWRGIWTRHSKHPEDVKKAKNAKLQAINIYIWYIREDAPKKVNLPLNSRLKLDHVFSPIKKNIENYLNDSNQAFQTFSSDQKLQPFIFNDSDSFLEKLQLTVTSFDDAQQNVFKIILVQQFVRFVESSIFTEMNSQILSHSDSEVQYDLEINSSKKKNPSRNSE